MARLISDRHAPRLPREFPSPRHAIMRHPLLMPSSPCAYAISSYIACQVLFPHDFDMQRTSWVNIRVSCRCGVGVAVHQWWRLELGSRPGASFLLDVYGGQLPVFEDIVLLRRGCSCDCSNMMISEYGHDQERWGWGTSDINMHGPFRQPRSQRLCLPNRTNRSEYRLTVMLMVTWLRW